MSALSPFSHQLRTLIGAAGTAEKCQEETSPPGRNRSAKLGLDQTDQIAGACLLQSGSMPLALNTGAASGPVMNCSSASDAAKSFPKVATPAVKTTYD